MDANVDTRELARTLRCLPRTEVEGYCRGCGMSTREMNALLDYIYCMVKQEDLSARLGMSRSTFIRHEKVVAVKLLRYMVKVGAIDDIICRREDVGDLVSGLRLFGK